MSNNQNNENLSPEQIAERQTAQQAQARSKKGTSSPSPSNKQQQQQTNTGGQPEGQIDTMQGSASKNVAKDNKGNVNISRGIIGLKSSPTRAYVTEGTIADNVNAPSKFPNKEGEVNPLSEKDLRDRINMERSKAGLDQEYQEQLMIKIRTESQGFEYKPEGQWADAEKYPELQPISRLQAREPNVNEKKGEKLLSTDEIQQAEGQLQQDQQSQEQQQEQKQEEPTPMQSAKLNAGAGDQAEGSQEGQPSQ